ncbi:hypothetical protein, partial [Arcobacter defluvii]
MIQKLTKLILISFLIIYFTACNDSLQNNKNEKNKQIEYKSNLPMPELEEKHINQYFKLSTVINAKSDPIPATQIGYAYANKLQDYEKALQWFEYSNSMKPTADNSAYA